MPSIRCFRRLLACGVVGTLCLANVAPTAAAPAVPPAYQPDDAGDVAFVRAATRALLARQPKGFAEVELLVDIAQTLGREAVVDLLMDQPEFERYWLLVLADDLKVDRDPSSPLAQSGCYEEPVYSGVDEHLSDTALIDHILANGPGTPYGTTFNMTDLLRSTIAADRLFPLYQVALLPMAARQNDASDARDEFMDVYLNRDGGCLDCHTSIYSKTDVWSGLDRFAPPPFALEHSVFPQNANACGTDTWPTPLPGIAADGETLYDSHCAGCHDLGRGGGVWTANVWAPPHAERVPSLNNDQLAANVERMWDLYGPGTVLTPTEQDDLMAFMRQEYGEPACLDWRAGSGFFAPNEACKPSHPLCAPTAPAQPWGLDTACGSFGSGAPAPAAGDEWMGATQLSPWGIAEALGETDLQEVYDVRDCNVVPCVDPTLPIAFSPQLSAATAFGYLVAYNMVDNLVHEVSAAELTISNRFARVDDANAVVRNLTEEFFLPGGLSLKAMLKALVLSPVFNRRAPSETTLADAYQLPMVLNPWAYTGDTPTGDGLDANGQGDFVHRYSVDNLLLAVHHALGWAPPRLHADELEYPTRDFVVALGQRSDEDAPGFSDLTFQALYEWENVVGLCQEPTGAASDWIDELVAAVTTETVEDVVIAVKDRLLQERVTNGELAAIEAMFGVLRTDSAATAMPEHVVRHYCGVLLSTPQFMLAGARRALAAPAPGPVPTLEVCLPDEECTAVDLCSEYESDLTALGYSYSC